SAVKLDKVGIELADHNNVRGGTRAQDVLPFVQFPLIDLVDSIYYRRIRNNSRSRICPPKDLQTEKMIGVLMGDVDKRQRLLSLLDFLQYFFSTGFCQLPIDQHHLMFSLDNDGVGPELIVGRGEHLDGKAVLTHGKCRRTRKQKRDTDYRRTNS